MMYAAPYMALGMIGILSLLHLIDSFRRPVTGIQTQS
jgi:hypothetical protein